MIAGLAAWMSLGAAAASSGERQLLDEENRWGDALVRGDTKALDRILADTYVDTDETGYRNSKQGVLGLFKSGDLKLTGIRFSDMKVFQYGVFAIVTGKAEQSGTYQGKAVPPKIAFTDSFVRQGGKWRAVASARTPVQ